MTAILHAIIDRLTECVRLGPNRRELFTQQLNEVIELVGWFRNETSAEREEQYTRDALLEVLNDPGWPAGIKDQLMKTWGKRPRGRPATKRSIGIAASEMKRVKGLSWTQIAIRLCPCEQQQHTIHCAQRIRQQVILLEQTLSDLGVKL